MNDGVVELAEFFELGDESPDGSVRVVDGAVVDGGLIVERAPYWETISSGAAMMAWGSLNQRLRKKGSLASRFSSSQELSLIHI